MKRKPTSPGEILGEEFLNPLGITSQKLAERIGCDAEEMDQVLQERARVSPQLAEKLATALGTTTGFWLNAQMAVDLWTQRLLS